MKALLSEERTQKEREFKSFVLLQNELSDLKRDREDTEHRAQALSNDLELMKSDCHRLKAELQNCHIKSTHHQGQITDVKDMMVSKDLENAKLYHSVEVSLVGQAFSLKIYMHNNKNSKINEYCAKNNRNLKNTRK